MGDRSLAEDLTQEVFIRVYQGLPNFSLRCRFTTWLFQVTKNRVLDELRALERRPRAVVNLEDIPPLEVVDAPFERVEAIDAVWRAVENLSVDLKMALLLGSAGTIVVTALIVFFVPKFAAMFERLRDRGELPWATDLLPRI